MKYHAIKEVEKEREIKLSYCRLEIHLVNILTKPLPISNFEFLRNLLRVLKKSLNEEC